MYVFCFSGRVSERRRDCFFFLSPPVEISYNMRAYTTPPAQRRLRLAAGRTAAVAPTAVPRAEPHAEPVRLGADVSVFGWRLARARSQNTCQQSPSLSLQSTGTAEFDGGVGVAAFRPPAPMARAKPAVGRPGVAAFDTGSGTAAFADR